MTDLLTDLNAQLGRPSLTLNRITFIATIWHRDDGTTILMTWWDGHEEMHFVPAPAYEMISYE